MNDITKLSQQQPLSEHCPICSCPMAWVICENGCDDGEFDDDEECSACDGEGGYWVWLKLTDFMYKY